MQRLYTTLLCFLLCVLLLPGCTDTTEKKVYHSIEDLRHSRIGVLIGSAQDEHFTENYKEAQIVRIEMTPNLAVSLKAGACDVAIFNEKEARSMLGSYPEFGLLQDSVSRSGLGIGFRKDENELREQFNRFLANLRQTGLYDEICRRWTGDSIAVEMPPIPTYTTGTPIRVGTTGTSIPFSYIKNEKNVGLDMELIFRFAASQRRPVKLEIINFNGLIPGLLSGKLDIIANFVTITKEREKQVAFSDVYYDNYSSALVLRKYLDQAGLPDKAVEEEGFVQQLKSSLYNNIMAENRYKLILNGLGVTLEISFFATIAGTLLGAFICFLRMNRRKAFNRAARIYIDVMRGTPLLVMLMLMYYVVFAHWDLSAKTVAIITFSFHLAAYVSEMFRTSIEGIDRGQTEAGIALGFTPAQTFIHIIMPQAIRSVLPVYKGEVISLIKITSIVGYIAVEDLTKVSDIIRSRTFDAFLPLVMVALMYFLIAWLFSSLLDYLDKKYNR